MAPVTWKHKMSSYWLWFDVNIYFKRHIFKATRDQTFFFLKEKTNLEIASFGNNLTTSYCKPHLPTKKVSTLGVDLFLIVAINN